MPLAGLFFLALAPFVAAEAQPGSTPPAPVPPVPAPAAPAPAAPTPDPPPVAPPADIPVPAPAAPAAPAKPAKPPATTGAAPAAATPAAATPTAATPVAGAPVAPPVNLPKGKPVCPTRTLPLVVGNTWTYIAAPPAVALDQKELAQLPNQPKKVVVTVKGATTNTGVTTVTLEEESYLDDKGPRKLTTTVVCSPTKFDIAPESFFFNGEPGGYYGLELTSMERKGTTWALLRGIIPEVKWREDLVINWKRVGAPGTGKLEMERELIPEEREKVETPFGVYTAEPLAISVTGRVFVDGAIPFVPPNSPAGTVPTVEPYPLKAPMINKLWLVEGTGVVKVQNSFSHVYVLSTAAIAK